MWDAYWYGAGFDLNTGSYTAPDSLFVTPYGLLSITSMLETKVKRFETLGEIPQITGRR